MSVIHKAGALLLLATSLSAQLQFMEAAATTGTNAPTFGRGAAMVDFDGDGLLDLATSNDEQRNRFFRQNPDHTFTDVSQAWGVAADAQTRSWGMAVADFDNDGDPDVVTANGGFYEAQPATFLRNDINTLGGLTDVSSQAGDLGGVFRTHGVTTLDYDRDGLLDVFLADGIQIGGALGHVHLLHNQGGMVFVERTVEAGLGGLVGNFRHCGSADVDNDGWADLGVGDNAGANLLLRNNGDGTFTDIAGPAGVSSPGRNFGFVFEDFNSDGWMDVYLPKYQKTVVTTVSRVLLNNGDGTFEDVSGALGLGAQEDMGHNSGDLDNDGYPELYIGTGSPASGSWDVLLSLQPGASGDLEATDVTVSSGLVGLGNTRNHGSAFGDFDDDGDVDVYINSGGPANLANTIEQNYLLLNQGNDNHWVKVALTGVVSNRQAVGARIHAVTTSGRDIWTDLSAGKGFGNTDSPVRQLGLGTEDGLDRIEVLWPSGLHQTLLAPDIDTRHDVIETGILVQGVPQLGGTVELTFVGPPDHQAELLIGFVPGSVPLPKFGGILQILPPLIGPIGLPLGPDGQLALLMPIPNDVLLVGLPILFQAWVHEAQAVKGGTLTDAAVLLLE